MEDKERGVNCVILALYKKAMSCLSEVYKEPNKCLY
jgi:hypothetical protein